MEILVTNLLIKNINHSRMGNKNLGYARNVEAMMI